MKPMRVFCFLLSAAFGHVAVADHNPPSTPSTWNKLTETANEYIHDYRNPDPPEPQYPQPSDLQKNCVDLYYELSALSEYSIDPGPQILENPYDFLTDPVNRAAVVGGSFSGILYGVIPVIGVTNNQRKRKVVTLLERKEALRVAMARNLCFQ